MKYLVTTRDQKHEFEIPQINDLHSEFQLQQNGKTNTVKILETWENGTIRTIMVNGKVIPVRVHRGSGNEFPDYVEINGARYGVSIEKAQGKRLETKAKKTSGEVRAFLPGQVSDLHIDVGHDVKKGQVIGILEAMKMENEIIAPCDGKIKKISVERGQKVMRGDLILEIN